MSSFPGDERQPLLLEKKGQESSDPVDSPRHVRRDYHTVEEAYSMPDNTAAQRMQEGLKSFPSTTNVHRVVPEVKKRTRDEIKKRDDLRMQYWKQEEQEERRGRVSVFCTAGAYNMEALFASLSSKQPQFIRDVIHVALYDNGGDVFYLPYGVIVMWGLKRTEERRVLSELQQYKVEEEVLALEEIKDDDFRWVYHQQHRTERDIQGRGGGIGNGDYGGDSGQGTWPPSASESLSLTHSFDWVRVVQDEIILPDFRADEAGMLMGPGRWGPRTQDLLYKLAFSYALATSVKLDYFEESIHVIIKQTKPLPEEMARIGRISLSRIEMSKRVGRLFLQRSSVNLHSEILDTPDFFWEFSNLEPIWVSTTLYLNIRARVDILNKRLDTCGEILSLLNSELNSANSARLETIIIW
eukprot:CAMPEP_0184659094 /NCGR_PEP_ID=MMETSP0308-20130426/28168_1 /TAXON_ID=38269 /ORGANISM="Gloeochaete witrockiana, Strain SAG 46.84" /LENGTH=410 /DNA_ID=CAMNT_0027098617 /DNA_START=3 /DNA_END=1232 /DNA_ORIENTATION=+